jgi:hypothetical protein
MTSMLARGLDIAEEAVYVAVGSTARGVNPTQALC